jgi:hypothetical protein
MNEKRASDVELEIPEDIEAHQKIEEMIGDAQNWLAQKKFSSPDEGGCWISQDLVDGLVMLFGRLSAGDPQRVEELEKQVKRLEFDLETAKLNSQTLEERNKELDEMNLDLENKINEKHFNEDSALRKTNRSLEEENRSLKDLLMFYIRP